jgi:hypothetical protein
MSEPVQLAKLARQHLAAALGALQATGIPDELMSIADPIAATMGILHRIERSEGADLSGREEALANVRGALQALQKLTFPHAAVDVVMDSIAQSLSQVHALSKYVAPQQAYVPPQPIQQAYAPPQPAPQAYAPPQPAPQAYAPPQPAPQAYAPPQPAQQAYAPPQPAQQAYAPPQPAPQAYAPPQPAPQAYAPPQPAQQAYAPPQPAQQAYAPQAYQPAPQAVAAQAAPQAVAAFAPSPQAYAPQASAPRAEAAAFKPAAARERVDVELGTHSASNFYKGLGGNDVIEAGGVFVATYKLHAIGVSVDLRVLMPGNYEFFATAVVQWIREGDGSTEPGFGARFTQISPEGRQLVYRYTRNREPIFYDDL